MCSPPADAQFNIVLMLQEETAGLRRSLGSSQAGLGLGPKGHTWLHFEGNRVVLLLRSEQCYRGHLAVMPVEHNDGGGGRVSKATAVRLSFQRVFSSSDGPS